MDKKKKKGKEIEVVVFCPYKCFQVLFTREVYTMVQPNIN